jgi:hypothetical protein
VPKITTTGQLTSYAIKVFRQQGYFCWRENTGGVWDAAREAYRKAPDSLTGKSDILGFHRVTGRFLACEIKVGKDRLSAGQEEFLLAVKAAGGLALVVRHGDDLKPYITNNTTT